MYPMKIVRLISNYWLDGQTHLKEQLRFKIIFCASGVDEPL